MLRASCALVCERTYVCALLIGSLSVVGCAGVPTRATPVPSGELRLLSQAATAHSAFHGAARVVSLGDTGFVAADPTHAVFFAWDGSPRGDVALPPRAWLAGVTSDARAIFAEPAGTADAPAAAVVARLGDGSRIPMPDFDPASLAGAQLAPTGTTAVAARGPAMTITAANGTARRVLATLQSSTRASVAWSPSGDRLAVVDGTGLRFSLFLVAPSGATGRALLLGDLGDNPGAALAWRSDDEIVVRRGGGAFHDSEIVSVHPDRPSQPTVLLTVPGAVSSIASHDGALAMVAVHTRRTLHRAAWTGGSATSSLLDAPALVEGTYLRPIGSLADGAVVYVERDDGAGAWVFRAALGDATRELGRILEPTEVAATTAGDALLVVRGRATSSPAVVDLVSNASVPLARDLLDDLRSARAIACSADRCVMRSNAERVPGVMLDTFDRATGARVGASCQIEGLFPEPTGLSIAADGTHAAFAGTTLVRGGDDEPSALDAATDVELATCTAHVHPVPGRNIEYAALTQAGMVVSGQDRASSRWGLWLVADGAVTALAEGDDRINRPIVQTPGTILFGQQHVEASIYLWTP